MFYAGFALFFGLHLFAGVSAARNALVALIGEKRWRNIFALLSLTGLVLVGIGYDPQSAYLYDPTLWVYRYAYVYMPIAFILIAAAHMPTWIRQWCKHPMLLGILIWSITHLHVNPDVHSVVLFGGFAAYSLFAIIAATIRGKVLTSKKPLHWRYDLFAVVGGIALYVLLMVLHNWLFGVSSVLTMSPQH